jgi:hypothetical protein
MHYCIHTTTRTFSIHKYVAVKFVSEDENILCILEVDIRSCEGVSTKTV